MSSRDKDAVDVQPSATPLGAQASDNFVSRWSRLKQASAAPPQPASESVAAPAPAEVREAPPTDADMPPLESLDETSDYTGFLSEKVSETLRRQALRKLFHSELFNVCDGLDDYAGDFTSFAPLGDIVTSDMRHQLALAEERLKAALAPDDEGPSGAAVNNGVDNGMEGDESPCPEPVPVTAGPGVRQQVEADDEPKNFISTAKNASNMKENNDLYFSDPSSDGLDRT
ncbi:DUF3306 domain-containing protein [Sedimenticola hydrogenitrophicus]|uniref:DUF3306 domain-containing protein n=1 Tax=Sedimenticola hydrogenitrophicus TaxID=2967975 RepID=UPI0023AFE55D|nr:DUF3306 domain-containing protein [Sedimenticola hydrogenitrophicus]